MSSFKFAFVFPGQGSQFIGMGKALNDTFHEAKEVFEEVDDTLNYNLSQLIFSGESEELTRTYNAQPAIMATSIAATRVIEAQLGVKINQRAVYSAGHSLGEYSALCANGIITLAQTSRLLKVRGMAMQTATEHVNGGMLALLGTTIESAEKLAQEASTAGLCQIANDNGAEQVVLSGDQKAINLAFELSSSHPIKKAIKLNVSGAFHSDLMKPAEKQVEEALQAEEFLSALRPIICNYTALPSTEPSVLKDALIKQVCSRVRWRQTMELMLDANITHIVEIGPGKVLSGLAKKILPQAVICNASNPEELDNLASVFN